MKKVLPLLIVLTGCAAGPSMEAMKMDPPNNTSEPMPPGLDLFGSRNEVRQPLTAGEQDVAKLTEEANQTPTEGTQPGCEYFWPFLWIGCNGDPSIEVTKLDQEENTYELVPRPGWLSFSISAEEVKQAMTAKAREVCAPGSVATLDFERPDYIRVEIAPRGYLHCR